MTPLEGGLLLGVAALFTTVVVGRSGSSPLWWALWWAAAVGALLVASPGNMYLVDWPLGTPSGGSTMPGGPTTYFGGYLGGGHPGGDLKFLLLVLLALGVPAFVRGTAGVEPLVIGATAVVAGLLTFSVDNLVLLYLTLELQALSLYTLVGFYRFDEERTDAALRYLLSGSLVSGFMLVGFARGYALNGTFYLHEFTQADSVGSAWVVGVLLFKVGTAPFHFWSPVVYAPLEWGTLALVLGATKVNVWYLLVRNLAPCATPAWWALWWAALVSVLVGSVGGYFQTNTAALLAYSGVVNGGYLLLLVLAPGSNWGFGYYLGVYLAGTIGLVAMLSVWADTRLAEFATWNKLGLAVPLLVYYLSLNVGGLPVFPGFFGKLALLRGIADFGWSLSVAVVALSIIPAVYYVGVAAAALFGAHHREVSPPVKVAPATTGVGVITLAAATTAVVGV